MFIHVVPVSYITMFRGIGFGRLCAASTASRADMAVLSLSMVWESRHNDMVATTEEVCFLSQLGKEESNLSPWPNRTCASTT